MGMTVHRQPRPNWTPSVATLCDHVRTGPNDDAAVSEVLRLSDAAVSEFEAFAQIAIADQTIRVSLQEWPAESWLSLPIAPLFDGSTVTLTSDGIVFAGFQTMTGLRPVLRLTSERPIGGIVITYRAGFGGDVPPDIALAVLDQAAAFYDTRGAGDGKTNGMSPHMARIAARYRRVAL